MARSPSSRRPTHLSSRRAWATATMLPNGHVLVTGGSAQPDELIEVNNSAEIWNPDTGQWSVGASGARPRLYHSFALLLPDASVLVGGGGASDGSPVNNFHAEIYYPPYLYRSSGEFASRPVIESAPGVLAPRRVLYDESRLDRASSGSRSFKRGQQHTASIFSSGLWSWHSLPTMATLSRSTCRRGRPTRRRVTTCFSP